MKKRTISRRDFLKGTAVGAAAIALSACGVDSSNAPETTNSVPETTKAADQPQNPPAKGEDTAVQVPSYEVINTDILIIGSGLAATFAASQVIDLGRKVTIISKGPYGFSGAAGMNFALNSGDYINPVTDGSMTDITDGTIWTEFDSNSRKYHPYSNTALKLLQDGQILPKRNEDGSLILYQDYGDFYRAMDDTYYRHSMDSVKKSPLVSIADKTMVTDVVINDGRCVGVTAVYLPTGDYRVYRANAVVACAGPTTWFYGWTGVSAYTINCAENTGDVDMALYRHGAGIGNNEFNHTDFATTYPNGLGYGFGTEICCDSIDYECFADQNGKQIWPAGSEVPGNRTEFIRLLLDMDKENDDILADDGTMLANNSTAHLRRCMEANLPVFEKFGIDARNDLLPIGIEWYERGGSAIVDPTGMTEFAGLFHSRGTGTVSSSIGYLTTHAQYNGAYCSYSAVKYADQAPALEHIDWSPAEAEFLRLEEIRKRQMEGSMRPAEVRHKIQRLCADTLGLERTKAKMSEAAAELERIRKEDFPKMCIASQSKTYNTDWKEAIENYNLLDAAELCVKACIERTETRSQFIYADYPEQDDENWNCVLLAYKQDDGSIKFEKKVLD